MVGYFLKKLIGSLFNPLTLSLLLAVVGILFVRKRGGKFLILLGLIVLIAFGYPLLTPRLVEGLVRQYPALENMEEVEAEWVAVLCGGPYSGDTNLPATSRMSRNFLYRLLEGVQVYRALPGSRLLVSVGRPPEGGSPEELLAEVAGLLGLPGADLVPLAGAKDTAGEVRMIREVAGSNAFVLVTSALHMPRAMLLCRQRDMRAIPAPVGVPGEEQEKRPFDPRAIFPSAQRLALADAAVHEYLGMAWAKVRGLRRPQAAEAVERVLRGDRERKED
jgi:uncharacterized SAM-binding protein YcdF (DUF218 family)